jgi:tetratricopeptide (TPR) repeat protein
MTGPGTPSDARRTAEAVEAAYAPFRRFFAGDPGSLPAARAALAQIPDDPVPPGRLALELNDLGKDLRVAYHESKSAPVLDAAIEAYRKAVSVAMPDSEDGPILLSSLAIGLTDRYDLTEDPADANAAAAAASAAVELSSPEHPYWVQLQLNLLNARAAQFRADEGTIESLLAAESAFTAAADDVADGEASAALNEAASYSRHWLGRALVERDRTEPEVDLDRAIEVLRRAANRTPWFASELVFALNARFGRYGRVDDLTDAISTGEDALRAVEASGYAPTPIVSALRRDVGRARRSLYLIDRDPQRLGAAIDTFEAALGTGSGAYDEVENLVNLANSLADRYEHDADPVDLDRAIELYEQALGAATTDNLQRQTATLDFGDALMSRYERDRNDDDLRRATAAFEGTLADVPDDWPGRPGLLGNLALALEATYTRSANRDDLERAIAMHREAATLALRNAPTGAVQLARNWGARAGERGAWAEAAEAYDLAIEAVARLVAAQTGRVEQEDWLAAARGLPAAAADALVRSDDLKGAIAALERGRTVLLSRALAQTNQPGRVVDPLTTGASRSEPPPDPIAYIAAAQPGGFALIVEAGSGGVRHVALDELREEAVSERLLRYVEAYVYRDEDRNAWLAMLDETGAWLWTAALGPLIEQLDSPRAVIIPVGWLGLLPLHAAWREDAAAQTRRRYALDEVTLAYAPNARAIQDADPVTAEATVLAVDDPQPVNAPILTFAAREAEFALRGASHRLRFRKNRARREDVLAAMAEADVMHFACHGLVELLVPLESGLIMAGNARLTLADVEAQPLRAKLAILSACETAMTGLRLVDEVVGLPAGLLQAGVGGVIGSLWSVNDLSTLVLIGRFYELLYDDRLEPAEALRQAQIWVRDSTNGDKAERFPDIADLRPPEALGEAARAFWLRTRAHKHPYHWAGFTYVGG